jgi:hypothetical protein
MLILPVSQPTTTLNIIKPTTTPISSLVAPALVENIFLSPAFPDTKLQGTRSLQRYFG